VIAGYGFGGLIWIPVQTSFVNPNNIKVGYILTAKNIGLDYPYIYITHSRMGSARNNKSIKVYFLGLQCTTANLQLTILNILLKTVNST
jgi:hypothetical protein